jgi:hypothetical protein
MTPFPTFETKDDFIKWAIVAIYVHGDKTNSNAYGNALLHAQKLADLTFPNVEGFVPSERDHYIRWAIVSIFSALDMVNSNAYGNALMHAQKMADLMYPQNQAQGIPSLPLQQPPKVNVTMTSVQGKAPPVPGERAEVPPIPEPVKTQTVPAT